MVVVEAKLCWETEGVGLDLGGTGGGVDEGNEACAGATTGDESFREADSEAGLWAAEV